MSPFTWQGQNLCGLSLAFILDWRVVKWVHNPPNFPIYRSDRTKFWWYLTCSEVRADHENVLFDFHSLGNMTIGAWLLHRIRCWTGKRSQGFVMIFCLRYGEWISKGRHLLDTFFALCRCLLSLNNLVRKWETKISKGRHIFLLTVDVCFRSGIERTTLATWQPAKFNLYLRKGCSTEQLATLHICWQFSRSNRVWFFGPVHHLVFPILPSSNRVFSWTAWTSEQVSQC